MSSIDSIRGIILCCLLTPPAAILALESDRQQVLEVNADSTDGTLGDGVTTLKGHVEIRQGTLLIRADEAEVDKADGKVSQITLKGDSAYLEQEIEEHGKVMAWARIIEYRLGSGMVTFSGQAEVRHPQYEVSGEQLRYDLEAQHFEGMGGVNGNGRIRIRLDPEVTTPSQDEDEAGNSEGGRQVPFGDSGNPTR